jgi:hypothetical protein
MHVTDIESMIVVLHTAATLFMTGLIWFVQVVHYPLKAEVGRASFVGYQAHHMRRTGWVVGPPMIVEALTSAWFVLAPPPGVSSAAVLSGLGLLIVIWGATAIFSVPGHARLSEGFDPVAHRRLVRTNWIRTVCWTGRSAVAFWLLLEWAQGGAGT